LKRCSRNSPTEHLDVVERRVVLQGRQLLETQLLTASVETVGAVDADMVVVAPRPILHRAQAWRTLGKEIRMLRNTDPSFHSRYQNIIDHTFKCTLYTVQYTVLYTAQYCLLLECFNPTQMV